MEVHQIKDQEESAETDLVYDTTSSETESTKKMVTFYFVKHHRYEDPEITHKRKVAILEIQKKKEEIDRYCNELLRYRKEEKSAKWKLRDRETFCYYNMHHILQQREFLSHIQNALDKNSTVHKNAMQSPEVQKLTKDIKMLEHRLKNQQLTFKDEKQLIKRIKELNGERDELVILVSSKNKKEQGYAVKCVENFYNYMKIPRKMWLQCMMEKIDKLKQSQLDARKSMRYLEHYLEEIDNNITSLVQKIDKATSERDVAMEFCRKSKEYTEKLNACYFENRGVTNRAKHLAAKKHRVALATLSNSEVEKFFSQWNDNVTFRNDYNRRALWSLDSRGLRKDGRIRNPVESSIVPESLVPCLSPVFK